VPDDISKNLTTGGAHPSRSGTPSLEEAWDRLERALRDGVSPRTVELDTLSGPMPFRAARILARDVVAERDLPACDVSAMDGYAFGAAAAETAKNGAALPVDATWAAGTDATGGPPVGAGCARKVMTGAPIPPGTDRVVPFEHTDRGAGHVFVQRHPVAGANIRRRGEVVRAGDVVLARGASLNAARLATAALVGAPSVPVVAPPTVAFFVTGDEVVAADRPLLHPGQVRDTHAPFLAAAFGGLGIDADFLGIVPDDPIALDAALDRASSADVVVATGGVSAGEFDFVEPALDRRGARWLFDGIAIQPGKPIVAATTERGFFLGLPGNPASAVIGWWLVIRPFLRRLAGFEDASWQGAHRMNLGAPAPGSKDRDRFLPATLHLERGELIATPIETRGSHDLPAYARAQALIRIRAGDAARAAGATVEALVLPED
jgi:molybdopterin molybdotransferase